MSLTDVLAIIGAVTGISGAILGVMSYLRDRARLVVRAVEHISGFDESDIYVDIYIINNGRQPVAIVDTGIWTSRLLTRPPPWVGENRVKRLVMSSLVSINRDVLTHRGARTVRSNVRFSHKWRIEPPRDRELAAAQAVIINFGDSGGGMALNVFQDPVELSPGEVKRFVMKAIDWEWSQDREPVCVTYVFAADSLERLTLSAAYLRGRPERWELAGEKHRPKRPR